jgi:hypothetical protein
MCRTQTTALPVPAGTVLGEPLKHPHLEGSDSEIEGQDNGRKHTDYPIKQPNSNDRCYRPERVPP